MDNRVRYTKKTLQQALLKLLQKKHIDRVTIKELCELAGVNRGTFYLHYATPNDLLMEIEEEFVAEQMTLFTTYFDDGHETGYLAELFRVTLENKELCSILLGKNGNPKFLTRIRETIRPGIIAGWAKEYPRYDPADLDYIYDYIFAGSMQLILRWIEDDRGLPAEELANRLDRLGHYCQLAITEFGGKK